MKRFIAILLTIITVLTSVFGMTGCSLKAQSGLTMGQWLKLLNDSFGMESYVNDEPYFKNIDKADPYFDTVQIAVEWNIISKDGIDIEKSLTWKDTLITLVNAGDFAPDGALDKEKIECGIKNFDDSIRKYWMNRNISADKAITLLTKAKELWANKRYIERVEKAEYKDNIVNLTEKKDLFITTQSDNSIVIEGITEEIKEGDICIVSDNVNKFEKKYIKIDSVEKTDGKTIVKPSADRVNLEDVYEKLYIEETLIPTAENTVIYDGNGNIVPMSKSVTLQNSISSTQSINWAKTNNQYLSIVNCVSNSHSFTIDGYTVKLGYNIDGKLDLSMSVEMPNMLNKAAEKKGHSLKFSVGADISDLEVTHKFDWGIEWKGIIPVPKLDSAGLKVDYKVKEKYGITYSGKEEFLAAPPYSNGNGKFLTNFKRAIMKKDDGDVYGAETIASKKEIKICSLNIYSVGVAKVCLDVVAAISVNGTIEITITESGSKGVEYKNGNLRFIKTNNRSVDAQAKAKVEATLGFGPALYVKGLEKRLVGVEVKVGAGASTSLKAHLADSQMHLIEEIDFNDITPEQANAMAVVGYDITADAIDIQAVAEENGGIYKAQAGTEVKLHIDWCVDVKAYGILSIGATDESYLVDFLDTKKIKLSITVLNEKNATFLNMHVDNFDRGGALYNWGSAASKNNCSLNYIPFDEGTNDKISEEEINKSKNEISIGENLILSTMYVSMEKGHNYLIDITSLPKGYNVDDVIFSSEDTSIAKVSENGVVNAVGEGCTVVCAKTKDGKYTAIVAVVVKMATKVDFKGITV